MLENPGHRYEDHSGQRQNQNSGLPRLGQSSSLGSILSLLGFPPEILKPPLSHLSLKDEIGLEDPDVAERRLQGAPGDARSTVT